MGCFDILIQKIKHKKKIKSEPVSSINSYYTTSRSVNSSASQKNTIYSKSSDSVSSPRTIPSLYEERGHYNLRVFKYKELKIATNNFSRLNVIGEGGFGSVYKGLVKPRDGKGDGIVVAVKKLNKNGLQGHKQWLTEVQFLGVVEHPNLVKLIGYCAVDGERGTQRLLVYEFMPNGSLEDHLFNSSYKCLSWSMRLQILLGVAQGLTYLHEGLEVQIIFRDFKASNILLDKEFNPKLSDFGLAREGPSEGNSHVSTAVMGTYGYAAPDYIESGHLTEKSDVWSFGVVLFEILTGRKSMERSRPKNEQKLLDWVKHNPVDSKRFNHIIDPRLENQYPLISAKEIARLANKCLSKNARERPKMYEVVESIKQAMVHKEMDGHMETGNDDVDLDKEDRVEEERSDKSVQRRMLHLDKLKESANVIGKRRLFMLSKNPDS